MYVQNRAYETIDYATPFYLLVNRRELTHKMFLKRNVNSIDSKKKRKKNHRRKKLSRALEVLN